MPEITEAALANFYGTAHYHRHWTGKLLMTDGVHYLVENGASWLVDAIASYQGTEALNTRQLQEFQLWELGVSEGKAVLTCRVDTGMPPAVYQEIEFTDFPLPYLKLYVEPSEHGPVLLLPSEH